MLFYYHVERTLKWNKRHDRLILYRNWTHSANMGWFPSSSLLLKSYCGQLVKYVMRCPWSRRVPQEIDGQNRSPVEGFKIEMRFSCGTDGRWKMQFEMSWSAKMGNYAMMCYVLKLCSLLSHSFTQLDTRSTRRPAPLSCSRGTHLVMMSVGDPRGQNSTSTWNLGSSIRTFAMSQCVQIHYRSCGRARLAQELILAPREMSQKWYPRVREV